jgi:hypothetical protein
MVPKLDGTWSAVVVIRGCVQKVREPAGTLGQPNVGGPRVADA